MEGSVFRRCGCRNPATGRKYSGTCPKLKRRDHGSWWARYDEPIRPGAKRQQVRIGPYDSKDEAQADLTEALSKINTGVYVPVDKNLSIAIDLTRWLAGRISLKHSSRRTNQELAALYLIPGLGHLRPVDLREHHIEDLYAAMRRIGRPSTEAPGPTLRRLLAVRTDTKQANRRLSPARIRRTHAVLHVYLNAAVRRGTIARNPAANVELPAAAAPSHWSGPPNASPAGSRPAVARPGAWSGPPNKPAHSSTTPAPTGCTRCSTSSPTADYAVARH
jgi:hypothetical protein